MSGMPSGLISLRYFCVAVSEVTSGPLADDGLERLARFGRREELIELRAVELDRRPLRLTVEPGDERAADEVVHGPGRNGGGLALERSVLGEREVNEGDGDPGTPLPDDVFLADAEPPARLLGHDLLGHDLLGHGGVEDPWERASSTNGRFCRSSTDELPKWRAISSCPGMITPRSSASVVAPARAPLSETTNASPRSRRTSLNSARTFFSIGFAQALHSIATESVSRSSVFSASTSTS